jgi:hypothetical protein
VSNLESQVLSSLIIQYIGLTRYVKKVLPEEEGEEGGNGSTFHT